VAPGGTEAGVSPLAQARRDRLIVPEAPDANGLVPGSGFCSALLVAAWGCGGSQPRARHRAPGQHADDSPASESSEPDTAGCHDETCFVCGGAMCLKGFYCDQNLAGDRHAAGCRSAPKKRAVAALKSALGSECSCEERDNGVYLRCQ